MINILKYASIAIAVVVIGILVAQRIYTWPQTIDFTTMLPDSLYRCNRLQATGDPDYDQLVEWFSKNTTGWEKTPASYTRQNIFERGGFTVHVMDKAVAINYPLESGEWNQVIRSKLESELTAECVKEVK